MYKVCARLEFAIEDQKKNIFYVVLNACIHLMKAFQTLFIYLLFIHLYLYSFLVYNQFHINWQFCSINNAIIYYSNVHVLFFFYLSFQFYGVCVWFGYVTLRLIFFLFIYFCLVMRDYSTFMRILCDHLYIRILL
jgi:hypothetical protein